MIELSHITFGFEKEEPILRDLSLSIPDGSFTVLVGASGSGKTTLLRHIAGLLKPVSGEVKVNGKVGMVFQNGALLPWDNAFHNVSLPLIAAGEPTAHITHKVLVALEKAGLKDFKDKYPRELSGGQRQRVGIARALAIEPQILLLDEPFSALDIITADRLRQDLITIWQTLKITIVMVSHSVEEAAELAQTVYAMKNGGLTAIPIDMSYPRDAHSPEHHTLIKKITGAL